ncbi:hypothetical protein [Alcaligenes sp. WGS1538]|uniref:hypothetical protein n=1 Tax=Alcaligenes sp. WGS1538 TaxID=3366811 RepID=UPI00372D5C6E
MTKPVFVDLNGGTARIDPQRGATSYIRLTIVSEQAYDGETDQLIDRGQVVEIYITADQADELAEALRKGRQT